MSGVVKLADVTGDAAGRRVTEALDKAREIAQETPEFTRCLVLLSDGDGNLAWSASGVRLLDGLGLLTLAQRAILDNWAEGDA